MLDTAGPRRTRSSRPTQAVVTGKERPFGLDGVSTLNRRSCVCPRCRLVSQRTIKDAARVVFRLHRGDPVRLFVHSVTVPGSTGTRLTNCGDRNADVGRQADGRTVPDRPLSSVFSPNHVYSCIETGTHWFFFYFFTVVVSHPHSIGV